MARGGVNLLLAALKTLSDLMKVQGYPGSQSHSVMKAGSLGEAGGEDANESEDGKGCEEEVVAAGEAAVEPVVAEEWSGHVSEKNAEQEVERD